jgi:hypothetical protein
MVQSVFGRRMDRSVIDRKEGQELGKFTNHFSRVKREAHRPQAIHPPVVINGNVRSATIPLLLPVTSTKYVFLSEIDLQCLYTLQ